MLNARMTAEQIELREGLEPTLVANKIARAVALASEARCPRPSLTMAQSRGKAAPRFTSR